MVIHRLTHNQHALLCNSPPKVENMIREEKTRCDSYIHRLTHNQHALLCNSHPKVEKMIREEKKRCDGYS